LVITVFYSFIFAAHVIWRSSIHFHLCVCLSLSPHTHKHTYRHTYIHTQIDTHRERHTQVGSTLALFSVPQPVPMFVCVFVFTSKLGFESEPHVTIRNCCMAIETLQQQWN
jgi:hypothetical protein